MNMKGLISSTAVLVTRHRKKNERKLHNLVLADFREYTVKKVSNFPVPSRDVTDLILQCTLA
jgi:hypothetical protein